jgi:hypothetical protein
MYEARPVRLEGLETPCLILMPRDVLHSGKLPEEILVDLSQIGPDPGIASRGKVTFRLMPSTRAEDEPIYREIFEE